MDLDKLLKDADSARKLNLCTAHVAGSRTNLTEVSHKPAPASTIASRIGSLLLLFLGSGGSAENDDEDNGNVLCDLEEFRVGDYDMSKPPAEQGVSTPYLRLGIPRY